MIYLNNPGFDIVGCTVEYFYGPTFKRKRKHRIFLRSSKIRRYSRKIYEVL